MKMKDCKICDGTGKADSGGVYEWGEPIYVKCECAEGMPYPDDLDGRFPVDYEGIEIDEAEDIE